MNVTDADTCLSATKAIANANAKNGSRASSSSLVLHNFSLLCLDELELFSDLKPRSHCLSGCRTFCTMMVSTNSRVVFFFDTLRG